MIRRLLLSISVFLGLNANAQVKVFLIGDSTTEMWKAAHWYPCMGWGAVFQHFFNKEKVVVDNRAVGGTTSKSYYIEHWSNVISEISSGDYLFISFGANDANTHTTYFTTPEEFVDYMGIYCEAAREKGAIPVLLSTVNQNSWSSKGNLKNAYGEHPEAMKTASEKYNTPFFDLYNFGFGLSEEVGEEYNTYYRYNTYPAGEQKNYLDGKNDPVHLQETGATDFARYIVEEIEKSDDERLKLLADATKPRYQVTFDVDDASKMTSISRSATFPEGINVTLKSYGVDDNKCCWVNGNGNLISNNNLYVYVMQDHDEHFTAIYDYDSVLNVSANNFKILPRGIVFKDCNVHTLNIYSLNGREVISVSTQYNYHFDLPSGVYILTIDGEKSTKIMVE